MNLSLILGLLLLHTLVSGTRISQKKCAEYRKMFPTQYHEGEDAAPKEFPFMAKIRNMTHLANGILISENFVLSAGHLNIIEPMIILGELGLWTNVDDAEPKTYKVNNTYVHPDFDRNYAFGNIALYQLNESAKFNEYVRPACLFLNELSTSEDLTEIGWGSTNIRNNNILHKITLNYISNKRCQNAYRNASRQIYLKGIDKKGFFCAESRDGNRQMISGVGNAFIHDDRNALDEVIGFLVSSLTTNEANVSVSVRVASYIDWIEKIVWPTHISTSTTTHPASEIEPKTFASTFAPTQFAPTQFANEIKPKTLPTILVIIATILLTLMLCASIVYIIFLKRKARLNSVRFQAYNDTVQVESMLQL